MATGARREQPPFNLSRGPLFRARLIRVNCDDHLLQFTIHHLVVDGRSVDILLRELSVLYGAFSQDKASPLPDLPVQYAEHAARRKRLFQNGALDKALSHWQTPLAGITSLLDLPTDRLRRTARHYRGQTMTFELAADRTKALAQLARRHNTTLFVVLLAMVKLLLHRLSGNPSIVVEAPLGNRRSLEAEGAHRFVRGPGDAAHRRRRRPAFSDLVSSVRRTTLGAFDHAGVPIHVLVGALNTTVDESHSALSQVMFNLIDRRQRAVHLESLNAEQLPLPDSPHSKFDMMLTAHLTDTLRFQLVYKRDLFSETRMQAFVEQFNTVVDQVLADPDKRVAQYSLVPPGAERRSGAGPSPPRFRTLKRCATGRPPDPAMKHRPTPRGGRARRSAFRQEHASACCRRRIRPCDPGHPHGLVVSRDHLLSA
jgi:hypothetical protein